MIISAAPLWELTPILSSTSVDSPLRTNRVSNDAQSVLTHCSLTAARKLAQLLRRQGRGDAGARDGNCGAKRGGAIARSSGETAILFFPRLLVAPGVTLAGAAAPAQPRQTLIVVLIHGKESALRSQLEGLIEGLHELG